MILAVGVTLFLFLALPAVATGTRQVTVEGPGLDEPIVFDGPVNVGSELSSLTQQIGFEALVFGSSTSEDLEVAPYPAPAALVAGLERYRVSFLWANGASIEFDVFPDASGGPIVMTEPGFALSPGESRQGMYVVGGWFRAMPELTNTLSTMGVLDDGEDSPSAFPTGVSVALGTAGAVIVAIWRRRPRLPNPVWTFNGEPSTS
jgi:hypothetical protein